MANNDISLDDAFGRHVMSLVPATLQPYPSVHVNEDGDCIEILLENESYRAHRVDDFLTVYYERSEGRMVGFLIKGARAFAEKVIERSPGFRAEFCGGNLRLEYLISAAMWLKSGEPQGFEIYMKVRTLAEATKLKAPMTLEPA
ncbi:MAG: hypothetical protein K8T91_20020 [Planctomycetes bacterium]|nr:hypothetical protein [Planctomycetota bacterium]